MKTALKSLLLIPLGIALLTAETKTDYSHSTDFGRYKTYAWLRVDAGDSLWQDRIQRAIDTELSAKGWQKVQSGGDASVAAVGSSKNEQQLETFYNGFGGGWFWQGFPDVTATTTVTNIPIGNLQVDIFDSASKKLIWRGSGEKAISGDPEKNEKKLQDIVNDMFKHFPPSSKG